MKLKFSPILVRVTLACTLLAGVYACTSEEEAVEVTPATVKSIEAKALELLKDETAKLETWESNYDEYIKRLQSALSNPRGASDFVITPDIPRTVEQVVATGAISQEMHLFMKTVRSRLGDTNPKMVLAAFSIAVDASTFSDGEKIKFHKYLSYLIAFKSGDNLKFSTVKAVQDCEDEVFAVTEFICNRRGGCELEEQFDLMTDLIELFCL